MKSTNYKINKPPRKNDIHKYKYIHIMCGFQKNLEFIACCKILSLTLVIFMEKYQNYSKKERLIFTKSDI